MCEEKSCERAKSDLCSCKPVQSGDILQMAIHLAENITDVDWCLTYQTIKDANSFRLCLIGRCRNCGGRLCVEPKPFGAVTTDDFLAAAYQHLHQFHHNIGQHLSHGEFRARFVEMFHDEDRAFVKEWLARPENQSVHTMYRRSEKKAYTIVHTSADADQGNFPPPMGLSTFDDKDAVGQNLSGWWQKRRKIWRFHFPRNNTARSMVMTSGRHTVTVMLPAGSPAMTSSKARFT